MASQTQLVPSPLLPRSPSSLNATAALSPGAKPRSPLVGKSPGKRPLPIRKPSLKASGQDEIEPPAKKQKREAPDYDMAEALNRQIESKYIKGKVLGEGTYALVYKAHLRSDPDKLVAIKKFKVQKDKAGDGVNVDTIREIKYLQELSHPNIVGLHDVFSSKDQNINMVIEYISSGTLEDLIKDRSLVYTLPDIKMWTCMLVRSIYFCHQNFVLHRDIKPGNLLIGDDGVLKLADFGLARAFASPDYAMTSMVVTLWYRAPELLFGARHYSGGIDIWSIGMILAELVVRRPWCAFAPENQDQLARGGGELGQLDRINEVLGTPDESSWPGVSKLPLFVELTPKIPVRPRSFFQQNLGTLDADGVALIMGMLSLDPRKRLTAAGILDHDWWQTEPAPTSVEKLPRKKLGAEAAAQKEAEKPGVLEKDRKARFDGVARKLDFGSKAG